MEMIDRSKLAVATALTVLAAAIAGVTYAQNPPQGAQTPPPAAQNPPPAAQNPPQGAQNPAQGTDETQMRRLGRTQICMRRDGRTEKAVCRVIGSGTARNDSCRCPRGGTRLVNISICGPGMRPPSEDAAFRAWRADTVTQMGTLVDTQYMGQQVCVRRR
jgi:hypothetical protein